MDQGPLVKERIEAGSEFLHRFNEFAPVLVAFWLKDTESGRWHLYVGANILDGERYRAAYVEIIRIAEDLNDPYFDPFVIRLLLPGDPLVQAAIAAYKRRPPRIPFVADAPGFGRLTDEEIHFVWGPTRGYSMKTGRETLDEIIDKEADFYNEHRKSPHKIKLPVLMAYDLAKCGRDELGEVAGRVFKEGIKAFEQEGFHGLKVEILYDVNAQLQFE
jgi:hypothetical protein